ncbi:hypothetical protein GC175_20475 [bacterium]|nr:hypothetical protein [bacterium]
MAISNKDRKILWSRSGNRCAICRQELVVDANGEDDNSVVGEECHIVARELAGPRGSDDLLPELRDSYDNLIILCRVHHKLIDDQPNTFSVDLLRNLKALHELWVKQTLERKETNSSNNSFIAYRVDTGQQITSLINAAQASQFSNDELPDRRTADEVGSFFELISEYIDFWSELGPRARVLTEMDFQEKILSLKDLGIALCGCITHGKFKVVTEIIEVPVMTIIALLVTSEKAKRKDEQIEDIMQIPGQQDSKLTNFLVVMRQ